MVKSWTHTAGYPPGVMARKPSVLTPEPQESGPLADRPHTAPGATLHVASTARAVVSRKARLSAESRGSVCIEIRPFTFLLLHKFYRLTTTATITVDDRENPPWSKIVARRRQPMLV
jgi:hypothetical protein